MAIAQRAKRIAATLSPLERKILPLLPTHATLPELVKASALTPPQVTRALHWLVSKKLVQLVGQPVEFIELDTNGKAYLVKGLPERRFLNALKERELPVSKISERAGLTKEEVHVCIGLLRARGAILLLKDKELKLKITDIGKKALQQSWPEENFLKKNFPLPLSSLTEEERYVYESLKSRKKILKVYTSKQKFAALTELGKKLVEEGIIEENVIERLTPAILKSGEWMEKKFREYDIHGPVPRFFGARPHHYRAFLDSVRIKFLSLGFEEMTGPIVESEFWNMDALFMPQFHSAREIHDVYVVKEPSSCELDPTILKRVKAAHESGGDTGSTGWRYAFDIAKSQKAILRSQGTACSARMLASKDLKIPGKYFGITRCFRKDVIDAWHNVDFYQTEGIVIEEGLNFRHLIWLLEMFAREFAEAREIKIVPGYFPFTEPSCELFAKHPQMGWIELGGAGILRPEVVKPLVGREISVLAWGLGLDRIAMFKLGINDIRQLFSNSLAFIRTAKVI
ncbi:MAG: phenylalanine--tRNA ligase subunit alpha [Candidatus Woesearchaeota archaeon]